MNLIALGLNHETAPVSLREKLAVSNDGVGDSLRALRSSSPEIIESVILSTCNRVEIYARVADIKQGVHELKSFLCDYHNIDRDTLDKSTYMYLLEDAVEHLFKVTSSLDSMMIGEPQILGQVKGAYKSARELNATGAILNNLFERSFSVAKRVRTETAIAENAVSISYAAVELARKIFDDLKSKTAMLIGAGEMIELAGKHLISHGVETIIVLNRTYKNAVELATKLNGEAVGFDSMADELKRCDIVISSTGAPRFIIRKQLAEKVIAQRRNRSIFFIDIAVPRDIEPSVNEIDNCYLYDIDDLKSVVESNMAERQKEAVKAEVIVRHEVSEFLVWLDHFDVAPMIAQLKEKMESIRKEEIGKTMGRLSGLSEKERLIIEKMTSSIIKKVTHTPIVTLKTMARTKDGHVTMESFRKLFNLGGS